MTDEMRRQMQGCVVSMPTVAPASIESILAEKPHPQEPANSDCALYVAEQVASSLEDAVPMVEAEVSGAECSEKVRPVQEENSGGNVNYYCVPIDRPKRPERAPYVFEVEDLVQALNMTFHEGTVLKSLVRSCVERELGMRKVGGDYIRDAEKMAHSSQETLRIRRIRAEKGLK